LLGGLGIGTGARIAVSNLAKLVPVWGSAFGATPSRQRGRSERSRTATSRRPEGRHRSAQERDEGDGKGGQGGVRAAEGRDRAQTRSAAALKVLNEQRKAGTISSALRTAIAWSRNAFAWGPSSVSRIRVPEPVNDSAAGDQAGAKAGRAPESTGPYRRPRRSIRTTRCRRNARVDVRDTWSMIVAALSRDVSGPWMTMCG
jgi:hypothetical protein